VKTGLTAFDPFDLSAAENLEFGLYWDGGHAVDFDAPDLFAWIKELTGYSAT
jgi:hypothetical protein